MLRRKAGTRKGASWLRRVRLLTVLLAGNSAQLWAGGPRWVTGPPFFTTAGAPVVWYTNQPMYFTDPGDLSDSVNHAAADAMVAAAAAVWNVPTASLVLTQGGTLSEHVSGANTFLGPSGVLFPADVQGGNYLAVQIAVIYDSDGSVTDLLLGNGASDPSGCLQNGVTESVDSIVPAGYVEHAVLILNGRCTGIDPAAQTQMQYQLMRAFGRVLGLGWSQTNDNVFTGSPQPTLNQALHWPIMHPIDIICGPYSYQCLPQPFTLRPDDLSALETLYPIPKGTASQGKTDTLQSANNIYGKLQFPNGQGMQGVNILVRRWQQYTPPSSAEDWFTASSVTGTIFRQSNGNPVTGPDPTFAGTEGTGNPGYEGYYNVARVPMLPGDWQVLILETEAINPLYTGQYAVGPYTASTVEPSGSDVPTPEGIFGPYASDYIDASIGGAAATCDTTADGAETSPHAIAANGWWTAQICGYGHTAWSSLAIGANRTFTVEVTAEDEHGFVTSAKAQPVIGLWNASDALGTLPTVAAAAQPLNGVATGLTTLTAPTTQSSQLRMVIADQRGDGRPDFQYQGRVLYADRVSPVSVSAAGGMVTITGMGFREGNAVTVNGVAAAVSSWSANAIVATVPPLAALGSRTALAADVTVTDLSTNGTTTMTGALNYAAPAALLSLLTAPSGIVAAGQPAATPFAVQVVASDGVTPIAGEAVSFTAAAGSAWFSSCAGTVCTVSTDAHGIASTLVTPLAAGTIVLEAAGTDGVATASFAAAVHVQAVTPVQASEYVAAGATILWTPQLGVTDNLVSTTGLPIIWTVLSGPAIIASSQSLVNGQDIAQTVATLGPLAAGASATLSGCAWTSVCGTFTAFAVDLSQLGVVAVSGANQIVDQAATLTPVTLQVVDLEGDAVAGAPVTVYQTMTAWQQPCPNHGRCPVPSTYAATQVQLISDSNGLLRITPEQLSGAAEITNLAFATGTQGFLSISLQKQP